MKRIKTLALAASILTLALAASPRSAWAAHKSPAGLTTGPIGTPLPPIVYTILAVWAAL